MIANHIHDALKQVHKLQDIVLMRQRFQGYSGKARMICGMVALCGMAVLRSGHIPNTPEAHLAGWSVVLGIGILMNYASLGYWYMFNEHVRRNPRMLKPAVDAVPALAAGAVFTFVLITNKQYDLLPGMWMILYGLAQVAYRQSLPAGIYILGIAYMICGTVCILIPSISFTNPLPMGIVFFVGEMSGGIILFFNKCNKHESAGVTV